MSDRPTFYRLDGHKTVPCRIEDLPSFPREGYRVGKDIIGSVEISTVFRDVDHAWEGPPILFETMIFGGKHGQELARYGTWDEAEEGHALWVDRIRSEAHWLSTLWYRIRIWLKKE